MAENESKQPHFLSFLWKNPMVVWLLKYPTLQILIAIVLAIEMALAVPHFADKLEIGGEIFLRLLKR